ncbi:metallophosphoesterase [Flavobacterium cyanobacteriorum]|uniref:Metallophosphoesterase n=1 Tax=Flavobacterium cyanobacteriorum TaxID=2022802 RepID=A0A255Z7C7_9FLAO|nr:metallophosphoesterase [Flavobacterium cyanobacteriorum]OYQ37339.1 metallophosphoesterase [Flavobacterium cyanobacteriorum]
MKFFWVRTKAKGNIKILRYGCMALLVSGCATYKPRYGVATGPYKTVITYDEPQKPLHRFYLIGDAGYANGPDTHEVLSAVGRNLEKEGENTSLLYLGDNIYPYGMPVKKDGAKRKDAEGSLKAQMELAGLFPGKTYFIPGNHDWYSGYNGLKEQEKFIEAILGKDAFLPGKGCGITDVKVNDKLTVIAIDSQWYIEDWDNYPTINDDCTIKTREDLFTELESLLNKNQDRVIVLAIHHPLMSNGAHGGQFSLRKQLFPLKYHVPVPVLGTLINIVRRASGYSTQDIQSRVYRTLSNRIKALIQGRDNVIVVSGHDHNLQYINHNNIHQIISGSGSKKEAAKAVYDNDFSYGGAGYAVLDINDDGTGEVSYFAVKDGKEDKLFEHKILVKPNPELKIYPAVYPDSVSTSVYPAYMDNRSTLHNVLLGKHYRRYYTMPIKAKTVLLDTLYGGLKPLKAGGGHQTLSLRLADSTGKEYAMRGLRKSATKFLQAVAFKDRYMGDAFENTFAEDFLMDFYTTAHPYIPYTTAKLAGSAGLYHSNPKLYYVPKQNALGIFNEEYGNELYVIDEHAGREQKNLKSFGNPDDIEDTKDVLKNLAKDPKYRIDEQMYIRARLFDMLIGDWDRHGDQWKWAEFKNDGKVIYRPIPKDHDQSFVKYDGALLWVLLNIPALRQMQTYKDEIRNVKWLNKVAYPMDLAMIVKAEEKDWTEQANYIKQNLTDEAIDNAFADLPDEVKDGTIEQLKASLRSRRDKLDKYALEYRDTLLRTVVVAGTDKKEKFMITRMPGGETRVQMYSLKNENAGLLLDKTYSSTKTKELWIYGLDDDDIFEVKGQPGKRPIYLRLLGGQNHDTYTIENGKKVKLYDFKSKANTYTTDTRTSLVLTDDYETNMYDYKKPQYNVAAAYPYVGFNPDDGVKLGGILNYTVNNFNRRPYSQKHSVKANYYFATYGWELIYRGTFMNIASKWNFAVDATYTSPNFSINYFGQGNETPNFDDGLGMNYNRVKLQVFRVAPSIFTESRNGSLAELQASFETIEIDGTSGRFINQPGAVRDYLFEHRQFGGINARYSFENYDNPALPALGMGFNFTGGWTASLDEMNNNFLHTTAGIRVVHKITPDDKLVINTLLRGRFIFNNNYEFYQGATLGGDNDLRGYRRERFTGRHSFFQSTDLRYTIGTWKSSFIPLKYGLYGGYDYGRVWVSDDTSQKWHQSIGGGAFLSGVDAITARLFCFYGSDGTRLAFAMGFTF